MPTSVAITSIIYNKKRNTNYDIYIVGNFISHENQNKLKKLETKSVIINFINIDKELTYTMGENKYVSQTACLKFHLPEIFPNLDKVLYLDSDIIVQKDLSELFNTDINNFYVAGIVDFGVCHLKLHYKELNYKYEKYFNSGVMLLNLKKMREENITSKLIEYKQNQKNFYMDQDAFNMVLNPLVKWMSYKYNYQYCLLLMNGNKKNIKETYDENAYKILKKKGQGATIIHYAYMYKPWKYDIKNISKLFIKYYKKSPYKTKKLSLIKHKMCKKRPNLKKIIAVVRIYLREA